MTPSRRRRHLAATLVAALAALALPAAAHAAPIPGATYGGGLNTVPDSRPDRAAYVSVRVNAAGTHARVRAFLQSSCKRGIRKRHAGTTQLTSMSFPIVEGRVQGRPSTSFSSYGDLETEPEGTAEIDLLLDGASGGGTIRMVVKDRVAGRRVDCDEVLPITLRSTGPDATPAAPATPRLELFGATDQLYAGAMGSVSLRVAANGRRTVFQGALALRCGPEVKEYLPIFVAAEKVDAKGRFRSRGGFVIRYQGGGRRTVVISLKGRFTAQGATGTFWARSLLQSSRASRGDVCRSGSVRFNAVR